MAKKGKKTEQELKISREKKALKLAETSEILSGRKSQYSDFDLGWATGMVEGEGCFNISFSMRKSSFVGVEAVPIFQLFQNAASKESLKELMRIFNCGYLKPDKKGFRFTVKVFSDLRDKVIPFFEKYIIKGAKNEDFKIFATIVRKKDRKEDRTEAGMKSIINDAYKMNPSGKRKHTREYLISCVKLKPLKNVITNKQQGAVLKRKKIKKLIPKVS